MTATTTSNNTSNSELSSSEILSIISEFVAYSVGLVITALMTNYLSTTVYSTVVLGIYSLTLLYPLVTRGSSQAIFTYLGKYITQQDSDDTKSFLAWEQRTLVYGAAVFIGVVIIIGIALLIFAPTFYNTKYSIIFPFLGIAPLGHLWIYKAIFYYL